MEHPEGGGPAWAWRPPSVASPPAETKGDASEGVGSLAEAALPAAGLTPVPAHTWPVGAALALPGRARLLPGARRRQSSHVATIGFGLYLLEFDLKNENGPTSMILVLSRSPFNVCMCACTCTHTCLCMCVHICVCLYVCKHVLLSTGHTHAHTWTPVHAVHIPLQIDSGINGDVFGHVGRPVHSEGEAAAGPSRCHVVLPLGSDGCWASERASHVAPE